jgi:hypothetical protein
MMEAARTSETLVNSYQTTRCYNPEDSHLQVHIVRNTFVRQNQSLLGYLFHCFRLISLSMCGLIFSAVIRMHPSKCLSVRRVLVLDLSFFIKLNSCSQRQALPNKGIINKLCFLIRCILFITQDDTVLYQTAYRRAEQNIGRPNVVSRPRFETPCFIIQRDAGLPNRTELLTGLLTAFYTTSTAMS